VIPTFDQIIENIDQAGVSHVMRDVCKRRCIAPEDMWARRRFAFQAHARGEFWAALRALDPKAWSYPRIGNLSGHDHTTVMSGERKHIIRAMQSMPIGMPVKTEAPSPPAAPVEEQVA
jgi:chromosomal replication initiation ATPase DnaA